MEAVNCCRPAGTYVACESVEASDSSPDQVAVEVVVVQACCFYEVMKH